MLAFMQLLTTSKWLPTAAEIRERVQGLHYEAAYGGIDEVSRMMGEAEPMDVQSARKYVRDATNELRGDNIPMLKLSTILNSRSERNICKEMRYILDQDEVKHLSQ